MLDLVCIGLEVAVADALRYFFNVFEPHVDHNSVTQRLGDSKHKPAGQPEPWLLNGFEDS